ncbi:MAG: chemotaxis protein CheB [Terrimicrobiaceae bacterium]
MTQNADLAAPAREAATARPARKRLGSEPVPSFPVAGIGASAGGLEAFVQLLKGLPPDTGMAFVLVQHLDPKHDSKLAGLLEKATQMPVCEATDGMVLRPNRVHVMPSNVLMTVVSGRLVLAPRGSALQPIDCFLRSLAADQGELAVGVILSGTGADGTAGVEAVKTAGGITFAEDSTSARFPAMPENAIASGFVDFVLSPENIGIQLARIARHPRLQQRLAPRKGETATEEMGAPQARILRLLSARVGADFTHYKKSTLHRRIAHRMVLRSVHDEVEYLRLLEKDSVEVDALFRDALIHVTSFFRDPAVFQTLQERVLPAIIKHKPLGESIRFWVPGCSTGEEVYSLAICLSEVLPSDAERPRIQIYATDISEAAVARGRSGVYARSITREVSPTRLGRFFSPCPGGYQVTKALREACIFARQNVASDPPFARIDLISCRNLLIYFDAALQKKVLPMLHYALNPGGYLVLGLSEGPNSFDDLFEAVDSKRKIFAKKSRQRQASIVQRSVRSAAPKQRGDAAAAPPTNPPDVRKAGDRVLLRRLSPCGVIIDSSLRVLEFRGRTSPYLEQPTGAASLDFLRMIREDLHSDVRIALQEAMKSDVPVERRSADFGDAGRSGRVTIEVIPFRAPPSQEWFFHVLFRAGNGAEAEAAARPPLQDSEAEAAEERVTALREQLVSMREAFQAMLEDKEATNEEMQVVNEEMQSANEELQSTNEELETAKEELQSANEELTTLNDELGLRNTELTRLLNDLNNLSSGVDLPVIMLDKNLCVRRFSSQAAEMFKLEGGEVGERIGILSAEAPELPKLAAQVMRRRKGIEREIVQADGHHYSLRLRPYLTSNGEVEGAVIFLVNIDQIKEAEQERQELSETLATLFESSPDAVMTVNAPGRIERVNGQAEKMFGYDRRELLGKPVAKLMSGQFPKAPGKRRPGSTATAVGLELMARRKDGSKFPVEIMLSPLSLAGAEGMIATVRDITQRKRVEQTLSQSREELETRVAERTAELSTERTNTVVALETRAGQQAALAGLSQRALEGAVLATLLDDVVRLVPAILGCEFCKVMELLPSGKALLLRAGIGWKKGSAGSVQVATGRKSQEGFTLLSNAPVIVEDLRAEKRFRSPPLLFDRHVVSGLSVIIHGRRQPYGVLAAHTTQRKGFTNDDVHFLQSVANVLAAAIERRELEEELLNISSNEQRRIGQDLHDGLCQHLAGVEFKTAALAKQLAHDPAKGGHAASIVELIRSGARQAWMLARGLSPVTLESHGLMSALRELAANSGKLFQITCRFDCPRPVLVANNAVAMHLYRIAQEAITNAVKHGHARSVVVSLSRVRNSAILAVTDNGTGLPRDLRTVQGMGLRIMKYRADTIGAILTIEPAKRKGTNVLCQFKLP